jgi:hypothetical protein
MSACVWPLDVIFKNCINAKVSCSNALSSNIGVLLKQYTCHIKFKSSVSSTEPVLFEGNVKAAQGEQMYIASLRVGWC